MIYVLLILWCYRFVFVDVVFLFFFFKQKTAYEMRISDWSSDVFSSDLSSRRSSATGPARAAVRFRHSAGERCFASASDGFRNRETPAQVRRAWWLCPCPSRPARSAPCGSARRRPAPFRHGKGAPRHAKDPPASAADDAGLQAMTTPAIIPVIPLPTFRQAQRGTLP